MFEANTKQLELINKRYNDIKEDIIIGTDYAGEGNEVVDFSIDNNGRVTMNVTEYYLNNQYALRTRWHERHPRFKPAELDYLLGKADTINDR